MTKLLASMVEEPSSKLDVKLDVHKIAAA